MRKDIYMEVKMLKEMQVNINCSALGRQLGCDRRTIKKYQTEVITKKIRKKRKTKLEPYKSIIEKKISKYDVSAKTLYDFIKKKGYDGKYGLVKSYVKAKKQSIQKKATIRYETMPGQQAQVDWKEQLELISKTGKKIKINIFLYLMGSSRWKYLGLSLDRKQPSLFYHLNKAFELCGGIPKEILFDNMKTVVDQTRVSSVGLRINPKMEQFAKDYSFEVKACMPYRPQTKGKVEILSKTSKRLMVYNEEFDTVEELEEIIRELNDDLNNEISQATGQSPNSILEKERKYLSPLPAKSIREYYTVNKIARKVSIESMIQYRNKKYSVPPIYLGKEVEIIVDNNNAILVYYDGKQISAHPIDDKPYNYRLDDLKSIMKTDLYKYHSDDFVEEQAKNHLNKLELIYGGY